VADLEAIQQRLELLEDVRAIEDLKHRYTAALDFGYDLDALAACFVPRGRWVANGFGDCRGHDEIRAFFARLAKATPQTLHYATSPRIEVAPDGLSAVARFYLLNLSTVRRRDSDELDAVVVLGTYDDRCVKIEGRWLFEELRVDVRSSSDWTEGWARQPWR
jgi:hypothetical protein